MSPLLKYKLRSIFIPLFLTGIASGIFVSIVAGNWQIANLISGFIIGSLIFLILYFTTDPINSKLTKKTNLLVSILILSLYYTFVVYFVSLSFIIIYNIHNFDYLIDNFSIILINDFMLYGLIFGIGISILINFLFTINTLLGNNVLINLLIGKYHKPRFEDRFFLLIDLKESTQLAEKLGSQKFLNLLNDFFYDVSVPVIISQAEIYKYVGDEIIISWKEKKGIKKQNALRCNFIFDEQLKKNQQKYLHRYGLIPEYKAALHYGTIASGELGYLKKEVAFMGDVLNTASRILDQCKTFNKNYLVSNDAIEKFEEDGSIFVHDLEEVVLRGKSKAVKLFALERKLEYEI